MLKHRLVQSNLIELQLRNRLTMVTQKLKAKTKEAEYMHVELLHASSTIKEGMATGEATISPGTSELKLLKDENAYLQSLMHDDQILETFDDDTNCFNTKMVECVTWQKIKLVK